MRVKSTTVCQHRMLRRMIVEGWRPPVARYNNGTWAALVRKGLVEYAGPVHRSYMKPTRYGEEMYAAHGKMRGGAR